MERRLVKRVNILLVVGDVRDDCGLVVSCSATHLLYSEGCMVTPTLLHPTASFPVCMQMQGNQDGELWCAYHSPTAQ